MRKFIMRRIRDPEREKAFSFAVFFQALSNIFAAFSRGASNLYFIIS